MELVDSEVMLGLAQQGGHELTPDAAEAEVLIVNTCAFIDSAKQESIDAILEMARHKTDGACRRLIVTGCMAERYRDELQKEIPEIDAVLGTGQVPEIVGAIGGVDEVRGGGNDEVRGATCDVRGMEKVAPLVFHRNAAPGTADLAPRTPHVAPHASGISAPLPTYI